MKRALTLLAALSALAIASAAPAQAQTVEGIAALVNDRPITTVDVRNRMRLIIASTGIQPSPEALERIHQQALRSLIDESLQLQQAAEFELSIEQEEVDDALADIAARNGSTVDQVASELAQSGVDISTLRRQLEAEIAWQVMVNGRYGQRIRVSNQQIEHALERIAASASQQQYYMAEILIEIPSAAQEQEAYARARTIMGQLQQGAPFQTVAAQFSDAPSAPDGGEVGWVLGGQLRPEVEAVMRQMAPGTLSNPIRVPGGVMIVAVIERRDAATLVQYRLTQITLLSSGATEANISLLERNLSRLTGCDGVQRAVEGMQGVLVTDLGQISASALHPAIREALSPLDAGQHTGLLQTAAGRQAFVVCERAIGGAGMPSREEVESQLRSQQLSQISRRWLRDLRRDSTIEIR